MHVCQRLFNALETVIPYAVKKDPPLHDHLYRGRSQRSLYSVLCLFGIAQDLQIINLQSQFICNSSGFLAAAHHKLQNNACRDQGQADDIGQVPGTIIMRPPAMSRILSMIPMFVKRYPSSAAATPKIPTSDVTAIMATSAAFVSISSIAGLKQKT